MTFVQENHSYATIYKTQSWGQLQEVLESEFSGARWVFRGQRDARWPLQTSLERVCASMDKSKWRGAEQHLLRQFRRRLHQHASVIPEVDGTLEWLALMQHHGAPTRLLDWTRSPFVAVYFAVEAASTDCPSAVWVVNRQAMHNDILDRMQDLLPAITSSKTEALSDKAVFNNFLFRGEIATVVAVEPFRMNERLTVQQGLFLLPTRVEEKFITNLNGLAIIVPATVPHLHKIELDLTSAGRLIVLEELRKMNIHRASLFPGIDGFAQSLATEIEIWGSFDDQRIMVDGQYIEYF